MPAAVCVDIFRKADSPILPSMLRCDFGHLADEVGALEQAGVPGLHLDVMDGNFVPNLTYGLPLVAAIRRLTEMPLDVHLMIERPQRYLESFRHGGADCLTIHAEAVDRPRDVLEEIRRLGCVAGLAISPGTPIDEVAADLDACDMLVVMSVEPGFGGQEFMPAALEKVRQARQLAPQLTLQIDGGVNDDTIEPCAAAGADLFVVGSGIFDHGDYAGRVSKLNDLVKSGRMAL